MGAENYTLGGHQLLLGATDVGHVASAKVTVNVRSLSHYVAREGAVVEDPNITQSMSMEIESVLEEFSMANLRLFFMADPTGKVGAMHIRRTPVTFKGLVLDGTGTPFTWAIPDALVRPVGDLAYKMDDWSSFALRISVLPVRGSETPYGTLT